MRKQIQVRDARPPLVVISRSHADAELKEYLQQQRTSDHVHRLFAEILHGGGRTGAAVPAFRANEYLGYRRWSCCGCSCRSARSRLAGKPLDYTPRESFLNPGFRVSIY